MIGTVIAVTTYPKSADTIEDLINALECTVSVAKDGKTATSATAARVCWTMSNGVLR